MSDSKYTDIGLDSLKKYETYHGSQYLDKYSNWAPNNTFQKRYHLPLNELNQRTY